MNAGIIKNKKLQIGDYVKVEYADLGWICPICGYEHIGIDFKDACDKCYSQFEEIEVLIVKKIEEREVYSEKIELTS